VIIAKPGWTVRAFSLDGTSEIGTVESGPYRGPKGSPTDDPIRFTDGTEHPAHLCEPAEDTLRNWKELDTKPVYFPKVSYESIAYKLIDTILGASWSSHLSEYVKIDWEKRTVKGELGSFVGRTEDGETKSVTADWVLEQLAPRLWAYQDDEMKRLKPAVADAFAEVEKHDLEVKYVCLPGWAKEIWPGERVFGASFCKAPFPLVMSGRHGGRFAPILGIPA